MLPAEQERILAITAPLARDWQYDLHEQLVPPADTGTVNVDDRAAREARWRKRYAGYVAQRDLHAFALLHLADARNKLAKLRGFEDDAAQAYHERYWTKPGVTRVLTQLAQHADVHKRYERLRADQVKRANGYDYVNVWDMRTTSTPPQYTIYEARQILLAATEPLGPDYRRELAALLDPANGRMDVVPGPHRRGGGFSKGTLASDSVFFSGGFAGTYNDMRVLMHEATHAVQRQLMRRNHVLPQYVHGPSYFAETYAIFNELLLADYLFHHESDPARRRFYLEQFFDGKGMVAFVAAPEAELEQTVYERVAAGTLHTPDELDALTKGIYSRYSIWPEKHDEMKTQWAIVPLMYEDPFYDVNYVYGVILGLRMYEQYTHSPTAFAPRFIAALGGGYDAAPGAILQRHFGIDLDAPDLVDNATKLLDARINDLGKLYAAAAPRTAQSPPSSRD